MRVRNEINYFSSLFLFLLQQSGIVRPQCPAQRIVRPPTLTQPHCAVTHAGVTQINDKKLTDCSVELTHFSL